LFALGAVSVSVNATAYADDSETIYLQRVSVGADGTRSYFAEGGATVTLRDGSEHTVDHDLLEDPDGNRYTLEADIYQAGVDEDVVYEFRLVRQPNEALSESERLEAEGLSRGSDTGLGDTGGAELASLTSAASACSVLCGHDELVLGAGLEDWAGSAARGETVEVHVVLAEAPVLELPQVSPSLADSDPVYYLEQMSDRLLAIEDRKTEMADLYEPVLAEHGIEDVYAYWLINAGLVEVDLETLEALAADDRVARLELVDEGEVEGNNGSEIMAATGIDEYLDGGYDGELPSGRSTVNDIYIGLVDNYLWNNHPAWKDCGLPSCPSRLVSAWKWNGLVGAWWPNSETPVGDSCSHGTRVAGMMLADLTSGQDTGITDPDEQIDCSGLSPESSFSFISYEHGAGSVRAIQRATWLDVDITNFARGHEVIHGLCGQTHATIDAANAAALNGVFFVKSAGNEGHLGPDCTVSIPGTAAGSFTVGALEVVGVSDLTSADAWQNIIPPDDNYNGSSRGGDCHGRSVIDLVLPGGKEGDLATCKPKPLCTYVDYVNGGINTSHASGAMSGAAADFKHWLADTFAPWPTGWTDENIVGLMHAALILQGDAGIEGGGTADPMDEFDDLFGAGRLSAILFDSSHMSAPWRFRLAISTVDDGETATIPLNPDGDMVNQDVPVDADTFRAAVWWYEPNLASGGTAEMLTKATDGGAFSSTYGATTGQKQRVGVSPPSTLGGHTWELRVSGVDVPASEDCNYYYGLQKRKVFAALFWEDGT